MKIRPSILPVLLALLLLLSQQLGMAHAVSHLSDAQRTSQHNKQLPIDQTCSQCLAFAQIGSALTNPPFAFFATSFAGLAPLVALYHRSYGKPFLAFQFRAPPAIS